MFAGYALPRLVGHLGGRLVDVDHRAVEVGEAHRHPGAGEHPRAVLDPGRRPVVVVGVQADAVLQLHLRLGRPVAPGDAVGAVGGGGIDARVVGRESGELARVEALELRLAVPVRAVGAARGGRSRIPDSGSRRPGRPRCGVFGIDVGGAAHALPVGDRAARRAVRLVLLEAADGAAVGMVVAGHHHCRLLVSRQEPEPRQWLAVSRFICSIRLASRCCCSSACGIATLLRSTQSGCTSPVLAPKKRSSERISWLPPTALSRSSPDQAGLPWRV